MAQENDQLLRRLVEAGVEFVLVGGVAANLHGSSHLSMAVVSLDDLIEVKAFVGRPKDKAVELELRAVRERLGRG